MHVHLAATPFSGKNDRERTAAPAAAAGGLRRLPRCYTSRATQPSITRYCSNAPERAIVRANPGRSDARSSRRPRCGFRGMIEEGRDSFPTNGIQLTNPVILSRHSRSEATW